MGGRGSSASTKSTGGLKPGWKIVRDRNNRVMIYDTKSEDPWFKKNPIGYLAWSEDGQISWVQTQDEYARQGVASALLDYVRRNIRPDIRHSTELSESGAAFAQADIRRNRKRR